MRENEPDQREQAKTSRINTRWKADREGEALKVDGNGDGVRETV